MAGIYIHIPFCVKKCAYCDFVSFPDPKSAYAEPYISALIREMERCAATYGSKLFDTVFIGGGTPSLLAPKLIERVMRALYDCFNINKAAEITIEANPGTLDGKKLETCRAVGINRLSLGLQSTHDSLLKAIGRIHSYGDFEKSYSLARECGFSDINIDVMYGLPMQTVAEYRSTLDAVIKLAPEHISAYSLILEPNTPLYESRTKLPDEDEVYAMHRLGIDTLKGAGYARYEISNYAKPGHECRHNMNYWDNGEYLGLGAAAHSAMRLGTWTRWSNIEDVWAYIDSPEDAVAERLTIGRAEEMFECMMLGLRKTGGIHEADFEQRFKTSASDVYGDAIKALCERGWLERKNGLLFLNERGLDMQNEALLAFLSV